jgi:hypothetical protein
MYMSLNGGDVDGTFQQITIPQEDVRFQHHPILYPLLVPLDGPFHPELQRVFNWAGLNLLLIRMHCEQSKIDGAILYPQLSTLHKLSMRAH